ncbi:LOW QUALITY PROTEIN: neutrophilic granule protein-like [Sarcophilus harrisii]|uniref:LOW QUALITY PROTEIN: neutrophilic granule protein-like n=1 Tax=Sarcophilus harrisii TaxID=9305 RepID=UPI000C7A5193|nr:LOW QUALITY PROTEIN: neutrophilic granule protein-like [Sarcophilus harrisii]
MGSTWKILLLLDLATAVIARPRKTLTFKDASVLAARKFNQNLNEGSKYRVVESSVSTPDLPIVLSLKFIIRETECLFSEQRDAETCAFRDNGLEKECTANFASLSRFGLHSVECNDIGSNNNQDRSKRSTSDGIIDTRSLPPRIRHIYEQAKYDIIRRILSNF